MMFVKPELRSSLVNLSLKSCDKDCKWLSSSITAILQEPPEETVAASVPAAKT